MKIMCYKRNYSFQKSSSKSSYYNSSLQLSSLREQISTHEQKKSNFEFSEKYDSHAFFNKTHYASSIT